VTGDRGERTSREHVRAGSAGRPADLVGDRGGGWPRSKRAHDADDEPGCPLALASERTGVASGAQERVQALPTGRGGSARRECVHVVGDGSRLEMR
jgi:hypothetical protein